MRTELKTGEIEVLVVKKHWFALVGPALLLGFAFLFAIVIIGGAIARDECSVMLVGLSFLICLAPGLFFLYRFFARKFDIWIVTDLRVIDEYGVFSHNAKESPLGKINNISYRQSLLGRIFNYGNVKIQTAAEMGATENKFVTSPRVLKDVVTEHQEQYRQKQISDQAEKLADAINRKPVAAEVDLKECPYCGETIKEKAKFCRFCQKEL